MATYGYARVSDEKQDLSGQVDALVESGVDRGNVFTDIASGMVAPAERDGFSRLLEALIEEDEVLVYSLDRISRDEVVAKACQADLAAKGASLRFIV